LQPESPNPTIPEAEVDELDAIAGLLTGQPEKAEPDAPEKDTAEGVTADTPEKVEGSEPDAAEKHDIDYGLKVPITGGEPVTLGELKDLYQNQQTAKLELIERENEVLRQHEKTSMLLSYVDSLPEHVRAAAAQQAVADYQQQMAILTDLIPETRTPEGVKGMKDAIYSLAAEYGVARRDVDQIKHAVTIKMMHDFARLKQSIKAAKDNVKPLRSASPAGVKQSIVSQSETERLVAKAKQTRNSGDEATAVAALLRSKTA